MKKAPRPASPLVKGPSICAPEGTRTPNLLIRSQKLYPIELRTQFTFNDLRNFKKHLLILFYTFAYIWCKQPCYEQDKCRIP